MMRKIFLSIAVASCAIFAVFGIALTAQGASEDAAADVILPEGQEKNKKET